MDGITIPDVYSRYSETVLGVPPEKNGDYAWLLRRSEIFEVQRQSCDPSYLMVCCSDGNAEADIRKKNINRGYIKGIIGLPVTCSMERGFLTASWCWKRKIPQSAPVFL